MQQQLKTIKHPFHADINVCVCIKELEYSEFLIKEEKNACRRNQT